MLALQPEPVSPFPASALKEDPGQLTAWIVSAAPRAGVLRPLEKQNSGVWKWVEGTSGVGGGNSGL